MSSNINAIHVSKYLPFIVFHRLLHILHFRSSLVITLDNTNVVIMCITLERPFPMFFPLLSH